MIHRAELKVGIFLVVSTVLIAAAVGYVAHKKGFFTQFYTFTLMSKTGEDLAEGMPVIFSGFKIGTVNALELSENGSVLIKIRIPRQHAKWIRRNSKFIVTKPFIGSSFMAVTTSDMKSPLLSEKIIPEVSKVSDINETIKKLQPVIEEAKIITANIEKITSDLADPEGDVHKILRNSEQITANLSEKESLLEMLVKDKKSIQSVYQALESTKNITARTETILEKVDKMAKETDEQVYGENGVFPLIIKGLKDLLVKLKKIDATIDNTNKISGEVADSTTDLKVLRSDIDAAVNSIGQLARELEKKIPFKKTPEIKLP